MPRAAAKRVDEAEGELVGGEIGKVGPAEAVGASLFAGAGGSDDWVDIILFRVEPTEEEGFLMPLPITTTELDIRGRFGGGRYRVQARNGKKQIKATREFSIAGDPVFLSAAADTKWRRAQGLPARELEAPAAPPAGPEPIKTSDVLTLVQTMQTQAQAQMQHFWQMQAAEQARRDQEYQRAEASRKADEDRREAARAEQANRERERDREFFTTMLTVMTEQRRPPPAAPVDQAPLLSAFTQGLELAGKLQAQAAPPARDDDDDEGDEEVKGGDPTTQLVQGAVRGIVDSLAGRMTGAPAASGPAEPEADDGTVKVVGPLAERVKALVAKAQARGKNPDRLLAGALAIAEKALEQPAPAPRAAPGQVAAGPAPADRPAQVASAVAPPANGLPSLQQRQAAAERVRNGTALAPAATE